MAYFIFDKLENVDGSLYRIQENLSDLNNTNINQNDYKIIEDTQDNFNSVKYSLKSVLKFNNNIIIYENTPIVPIIKNELKFKINEIKNIINPFLKNNKNHPLFDRWNNYYNQLNSLDLDSITYPLNKSLEQYFNDLGQPSYNILQLP